MRAAPSPRRVARDDRGATSPCTAIERRSVTNRSGRSFSAFVASGSSAMPKRPTSPTSPRNTLSAVGASARASAGRNSGSCAVRALLHHDEFAADRERGGARVGLAGAQKRRVGAALGDALQNARRIAKQRLWPEVVTGWHERTPAGARQTGMCAPSRQRVSGEPYLLAQRLDEIVQRLALVDAWRHRRPTPASARPGRCGSAR